MMNKLWSAVATFNVLFLLNLFALDRTNNSPIDVFNPAQNWSEAPLYGLSIGTLATILSSYLLIFILRHRLNYTGIDRTPSLWIDVLEDLTLNRRWKLAILVVTVLLPLIIQLHFWFRFHEWQAWTHHTGSKDQLVSLYQYVSPQFLFDWDGHRYGDYSKLDEKGWGGISYVPFWQPIFMVLLSLWSLTGFVKIAHHLYFYSANSIDRKNT